MLAYEPTPQQRDECEILLASGWPQDDIAAYLGIDAKDAEASLPGRNWTSEASSRSDHSPFPLRRRWHWRRRAALARVERQSVWGRPRVGMTSAERKRRYRERRRNGVVRIVVELDRLWWAEALWQGGFIPNPDDDNRATLQAATQVYLETVIEIARDEGRVPQSLRQGCYVPTKRMKTDSKEQTP